MWKPFVAFALACFVTTAAAPWLIEHFWLTPAPYAEWRVRKTGLAAFARELRLYAPVLFGVLGFGLGSVLLRPKTGLALAILAGVTASLAYWLLRASLIPILLSAAPPAQIATWEYRLSNVLFLVLGVAVALGCSYYVRLRSGAPPAAN